MNQAQPAGPGLPKEEPSAAAVIVIPPSCHMYMMHGIVRTREGTDWAHGLVETVVEGEGTTGKVMLCTAKMKKENRTGV